MCWLTDLSRECTACSKLEYNEQALQMHNPFLLFFEDASQDVECKHSSSWVLCPSDGDVDFC